MGTAEQENCEPVNKNFHKTFKMFGSTWISGIESEFAISAANALSTQTLISFNSRGRFEDIRLKAKVKDT